MVQVSNNTGQTQYKTLADLLEAQKRTSTTARTSQGAAKGTPNGFDVNDTIDIRGGGKIVNVARGLDLAKQVRAEKDPEKVRALIEQGSQDVKRIGRLFSETFKTLFAGFGRRY